MQLHIKLVLVGAWSGDRTSVLSFDVFLDNCEYKDCEDISQQIFSLIMFDAARHLEQYIEKCKLAVMRQQ